MFGDKLKKLRETHYDKDIDFSRVTKITTSQLSDLYSGKIKDPGISILGKILENTDFLNPELLWCLLTDKPIPGKIEVDTDKIQKENEDLRKEVQELKARENRYLDLLDKALSRNTVVSTQQHEEQQHENENGSLGQQVRTKEVVGGEPERTKMHAPQ